MSHRVDVEVGNCDSNSDRPPARPAAGSPKMSESESRSTRALRSVLKRSPASSRNPSTHAVKRSEESLESFATAKSIPSSPTASNPDLRPSTAQSSSSAGPPPSAETSRSERPFDDRQATPTPTRYIHQSDGERVPSKWDSDDNSISFPSRGTLSDGLPTTSSRYFGSARALTKSQSSRLHTSGTNPIPSGPSPQTYLGSLRIPTSPTRRRSGGIMPPLPSLPPPSDNLPPPPRQLGRARSASLLEIATTVAQSRDQVLSRDQRAEREPHDVRKRSNTQARTSSSTSPSLEPVFTVLVIGSPQCGKSTLVSKGLKHWTLSRERSIILGGSIDPQTGNTLEIRATARLAQTSHRSIPNPIDIIEVSSTQLSACRGTWPQVISQGPGMLGAQGILPRGRVVDGLVVCYNVVDPESWRVAQTILSQAAAGYSGQRTQAIVTACKSDLLEVPVSKDHTDFHPVLSQHSADVDVFRIGIRLHRRQESIDSPLPNDTVPAHHNLGLVPVAYTEGTGRKKMADSFNWLFKRMERVRRDLRSLEVPSVGTRSPTVGLLSPTSTTPPSSSASRSSSSQPPSSKVRRSKSPSGATIHSSSSSLTTPSSRPPSLSFSSPPTATESSRSLRSTSSSNDRLQPPTINLSIPIPSPNTNNPGSPRSPVLANRARSTSDLVSELVRTRERDKAERDKEYAGLRAAGKPTGNNGRRGSSASGRGTKNRTSGPQSGLSDDGGSGRGGPGRAPNITVSILPSRTIREPPPMQFATYDTLVDKLFLEAVTNDDEIFTQQFLLIYRAFTTPRRLLLSFLERLKFYEGTDGMLTDYVEMRICALLDKWLEEEIGDLAAPDVEPIFKAIVNHLLKKPHLLHYASDLYGYISIVSQLSDLDRCWAFEEQKPSSDQDSGDAVETSGSGYLTSTSRDEARSSTGRLTASEPTSSAIFPWGPETLPPRLRSLGLWIPAGTKASMKELLKVSAAIVNLDPARIAEEITRIEVPIFLSIEPRDWLRSCIGRKKAVKNGRTFEEALEVIPPSLRTMARFYNYLANWTTSIILVHDKPRARAKIMEKMMGVARALRAINNYSGLRAVVSGINMVRKDNDPVSEIIVTRPVWKAFQSLQVLLGTSRMHSAYRMALKHTIGPAIPSMEVHTYDLVRADDTNCDFKPSDPNLIHWGKYSLMSKMIINVEGYQKRFEDSKALEFPENKEIFDLITNVVVMDEETVTKRSDPKFYEATSFSQASEAGTARIKSFFRRQ